MHTIKPFLYVAGAALVPLFALAHGEVDDGHVEAVAVANPEQRMTVLAVVGVVFVLMGIFVWYARSKNAPTAVSSEKKDGVNPS